MKNIGLTGGIGSGKSTIVKIFSILDVPCYSADERSKALLDENSDLKKKLTASFGSIYNEDKIDRQAFANIIFKDESKRLIANEIIHPFVRRDYAEWMAKQNASYVIQEAAILFETGAYEFFDKTILITSPEEVRIERIQKRDQSSMEEVIDRLKAQWSDDRKKELADFVIINDEQHSIVEQVLQIHRELKG